MSNTVVVYFQSVIATTTRIHATSIRLCMQLQEMYPEAFVTIAHIIQKEGSANFAKKDSIKNPHWN